MPICHMGYHYASGRRYVNFIFAFDGSGVHSVAVPQPFSKMKIMSTGQSNKSTNGGNHSSTGSDESIKHSDDNPHPMSKGVPPESMGKNDGKEWQPSWEGSSSGITEIKGGGSVNSDAAKEAMCKHP